MAEEKIIQQKAQEGKISGVADIILLIDATESMKPCIDGLKENISKNFVDALGVRTTKGQQKIDWRARVIPFRDFVEDGKEWTDLSMDFVTTPNDLKSQLAKLEAKGGGDFPETVLDAIYTAIKNTVWRPIAHRFIILFSDAETKPSMQEGVVEKDEATDSDHLKQIIIQNKIRIYAVVPEHESYKTLFNDLPKSVVMYIGKSGEEETYKGLKNQDFVKLLDQIAKTVSKSSGEVIKT